jgi:CHASE3 domain sensor protein
MPQIRLTLGRKLAAAFGAVVVVFVVAIAIALEEQSSAERAWVTAVHWRKAIDAADQQLTGTRTQMASQARGVLADRCVQRPGRRLKTGGARSMI